MKTKRQIAALRYMIFNAKNYKNEKVNTLAMQVLAFLIDKSEQLTKEVCLSLVADREGYTAEEITEAAYAVGGMQSSNGTTHLDGLMSLIGGGFTTSVHYGDFDPTREGDPHNTDGQFAGWDVSKVQDPGLVIEGMPTRYTFWISKGQYSRGAELVVATRAELDEINVRNSGLYPSLEKHDGIDVR